MFKVSTFNQPFIASGTRQMHAIVTIEASDLAVASHMRRIMGFVIDTSGSMEGEKLSAAIHGAKVGIQQLPEDFEFFVVGFSNTANLIVPLTKANLAGKNQAQKNLSSMRSGGGTAMSRGLGAALQIFQTAPDAIKLCMFLTDGQNTEDHSYLVNTIRQCTGKFNCEFRGLGDDWNVSLLQQMAQTLLGSADIIAEPSALVTDFTNIINRAQDIGLDGVKLRLTVPPVIADRVKVVTVKLVNPEEVDITSKGARNQNFHEFATAAWGNESRDYHVILEIDPPTDPAVAAAGMMLARAGIFYKENGQEVVVNGTPPITIKWTDDLALSTRVDARVQHYVGESELGVAMREGVEALQRGDEETATRRLGAAAQLAAKSGNDEATRRIEKVANVLDADKGTVRVRRDVKKVDMMAVEVGSTRTRRAPAATS